MRLMPRALGTNTTSDGLVRQSYAVKDGGVGFSYRTASSPVKQRPLRAEVRPPRRELDVAHTAEALRGLRRDFAVFQAFWLSSCEFCTSCCCACLSAGNIGNLYLPRLQSAGTASSLTTLFT